MQSGSTATHSDRVTNEAGSCACATCAHCRSFLLIGAFEFGTNCRFHGFNNLQADLGQFESVSESPVIEVVSVNACFRQLSLHSFIRQFATPLEIFKHPFSERAQRWLVEVRDNGERFGIDSY